jgi:MurNAc alpha-1-phosphate uridylyltransferase
MITQAFILAAGYGKRMKPITDSIPKPMIEVGGKSMISRILDQLIEYGVRSIVINTYYKKELLQNHIKKYISTIPNPPKIHVIEEDELLETGGGILNALQHLDATKPFFVANSDSVFIGENIFTFLNNAWNSSMTSLMLLVHKDKAIGYDQSGDFSLTNDEEISIRENPEYAFSGIHISSCHIFKGLEISPIKLMDIYQKYLKNTIYQGFYGRAYAGQWFHVGTPSALAKTEKLLESHPHTS